jgi:mono/diheme cytochrome c family protein
LLTQHNDAAGLLIGFHICCGYLSFGITLFYSKYKITNLTIGIVMSEGRDTYNHTGFLSFVFSMGFVLAFFIYIVAIHPGVDLKENVKAVTTGDSTVVDPLAGFDASKVTEPWKSDDKMLAYGTKLYAQNCAMCHGEKGLGDGAAGAALNPKPRNLVEGPWKKGAGQIAHYKTLTDGIAGSSMSSYKHLKPVDRWALVHFIESITKAKGSDTDQQLADFGKTAN